MNGELYFDGKKYISSSRAAKISGYVNDYIEQLCRDGKVEARRVGRSWYISFESLLLHKQTSVIGKQKRRKRLAEGSKTDFIKAQKNQAYDDDRVSVGKVPVVVFPAYLKDTQKNFQEGDLGTTEPTRKIPVFSIRGTKGVRYVNKILAATLLLLLILSTPVLLPKDFSNEGLSYYVRLMGNQFAQTGRQNFSLLERVALNTYYGVHSLLHKGAEGYRFLAQNTISVNETYTSPSPQMPSPVPVSRGFVVIPEDQGLDVKQIQESFSDDVIVEPSSDGSSGVIKPVFKNVSGDEYVYVLVPIRN